MTVTTSVTTPVGTYPLSVTGSSGGLSHNAATSLTVTALGTFTPIRINTGGGAYTDTLGNAWTADSNYSGGTAASTTSTISGTPDQPLYQNWRGAPDSAPLTYTFNSIPNGNYTVTLDFADPISTVAGQRVFNVAINGSTVLTNFDLYQTVGRNTATSQSFPIVVTGGTIAIQFTKSGGVRPPLVNALAIVSSGSSSPSLTSITPNNGIQGAVVPVTLAGSNLTGATINPPTGITVSGVTVTSTSITATFTISSTAPTGPQNVTVTAGGVTSSPVVFTVNPAPALTSITPNNGMQGGTVSVTLAGSNLTGATINPPTGITVSGVTVTASSVTATFTISSTAPTGAQSVSVTAGGVTSNAVTFTVNPGPSLTSITPNNGTQGAVVSVTLAGSNLSGASINAPTGITVSGVTPTLTSISATFTISSTAPTGPQSVTVTSGGVTSNSVTFTVNPAPSLTSITPNTGTQGGTVGVTLAGSNLTGATINAPTGITVSGVTVTASSITATFTIAGTAPTGAQSVTVTAAGGTSNPVTFTVNPAPSLTSITPDNGNQGAVVPVTIAGSNLTGATINAPTGITVSAVTVTASSITATFTISSTAPTGAQSVTVTAGGVTSSAVTFTVNPAPALTSITPNNGTQGTAVGVTIAGTNLTGATINALTAITVSGVTVTSTSITATFTISGTAPTGPQSVTVTAGGVTSNAVTFTVNPAPALTSITPNNGTQGTAVGVTIAGLNLTGATINAPTGITVSGVTVTASSITATFTIAGTAPTGPQSVTVTAGGVTSNAVTFTVNAAFAPIRINTGGGAYTDSMGNVWSADSNYSSGTTAASTTNLIAGTADPALYQNWRGSPDTGPMAYTFNGIPNGNRTVTLDFADPIATAAGQRVFNVTINGVTVLSNLDIYQTVGPNRALSQSFAVTVTSGQIVIQFAKSAGFRASMINALAIQ